MTIPTRDWIPTPVSGAIGSYLNWQGNPVDAESMVNALVDLLKPFFLASTHFDLVTVYTQATPTADNIPRKSVALSQVGTNGATNPSAAVSATFNFKTTANGDAKLVCLDVPFGSNWLAPLKPAAFSADILALAAEFESDLVAWSGRDDTKPDVLRTVTYDVNDELQKKYFK